MIGALQSFQSLVWEHRVSKEKAGMLVSAYLMLARWDVGQRWGESNIKDFYNKDG